MIYCLWCLHFDDAIALAKYTIMSTHLSQMLNVLQANGLTLYLPSQLRVCAHHYVKIAFLLHGDCVFATLWSSSFLIIGCMSTDQVPRALV